MQVCNRLGRVAAIAIQQTEQVINAYVFRGQRACLLKPLCGSVEGSLTQRQDAPICPCGRLTGNEFCSLPQTAVGTHVVPYLQSCQPNVEAGDKIGVGLRGLAGQGSATMTSTGKEHSASQHSGDKPMASMSSWSSCVPVIRHGIV